MKEKQSLNSLAGFVHGVLFLGHSLAIIYNHKRGNHKQSLLHIGIVCFELWAMVIHIKDSQH